MTIIPVPLGSRRYDVHIGSFRAEEIARLTKDREDERAILNRASWSRLKEMLIGQTIVSGPKGVKKGATIDEALLEEVEKREWWKIAVADDARQSDLEAVKAQYDEAVAAIVAKFDDRVEKLIASM